MVAKTGVIGMFGQSHQLHRVVARTGNSWQDMIGEVVKTRHLLSLATHTDMRLVDERYSGFIGYWSLPGIWRSWLPDDC